jgi:hypothetical protein
VLRSYFSVVDQPCTQEKAAMESEQNVESNEKPSEHRFFSFCPYTLAIIVGAIASQILAKFWGQSEHALNKFQLLGLLLPKYHDDRKDTRIGSFD